MNFKVFFIFFSFTGIDLASATIATDAQSFTPNESFLRTRDNQHVTGSDDQRKKEFEDGLLDRQALEEMRLEYDDIRRDPWLRRASGFTPSYMQSAEYDTLRDFSSRFLTRIFRNQVKTRLSSTGTTSSPAGDLQQSIQSVQQSVASVTNQSFEVAAKPSSGLQIKTGGEVQLPASKARVWAHSPIVNAAADLEYARPWPINISTFQIRNIDRRRDALELSIWRNIPVLNIDGTMTYGADSTILSAGFSTEILPSVSARIGAQTGLDPVKSGLGTSVQKEFRIDYSLRF